MSISTTVGGALSKARDAVADAVSPRDRLVQQYSAMAERHSDAGAEDRRLLDEAEADVARWLEPQHRLARVKDAIWLAGLARDRERAAIERQLQENRPRDL